MSLSEALVKSSEACKAATTALTHLLQPRVSKSNPDSDCLKTFEEAQAFATSVRAVIQEATPVLPLLRHDANCVGKNSFVNSSPLDVCNGFDAIAEILIKLLDLSNETILFVAATFSRWHDSSASNDAFDRMVVHHNQLRGLRDILHIAAKIATNVSDPSKSLFVSVGQTDLEGHPFDWISNIKLQDFYGPHFGFHYTPELRSVLRVINIARSSVHRSHNGDESTPQVLKDLSMLGWGWIFSNKVIMSNLGISVDDVSQIGSESNDGSMTIEQLRKFLNLIDDPVVTSASNISSADVAVNSTFSIPPPGVSGALVSPESLKPVLQPVLNTITKPVDIRVMSAKNRPLDLTSEQRTKSEQPSENSSHILSRQNTKAELQSSVNQSIVVPPETAVGGGLKLTQKTIFIKPNDPSSSKENSSLMQTPASSSEVSGVDGSPTSGDSDNIVEKINSGLKKIQENVATFFGGEKGEPARALIIHFHGGGFVSQSSEAHAMYLREWCSDIDDVVICAVDYKLAPEHPYPLAIDECLYAYLWALQNASRLGTLAERVVFVGDSAGGNLAMAVALKVNELNLRAPDGLCLAYPSLFLTMAWSPSRLLSFFDPVMPLSVLDLCQKCYVPDDCDGATDPMISPLVASDKDLSKLPPVTVVCGSLDPLLDDTAQFSQRLHDLRDGDIFRVCQMLPHGFLNMVAVNDPSKVEMRFLGKMISQYLDLPFKNASKEDGEY